MEQCSVTLRDSGRFFTSKVTSEEKKIIQRQTPIIFLVILKELSSLF